MIRSSPETSGDIDHVLGLNQQSSSRKLVRWLIAVVCVVALIAVVILSLPASHGNAVQFTTSEAQRGDLTVTVTATGELEPTTEVSVGIEVSGTVHSVAVDYNDRVKVGQVLARLDTNKLEAQVLQSQAALESAQAKLQEAQATGLEARNSLNRLKYVRELSDRKVPSQHELDAAEATLKRALANEAVVHAQIAEAKAKLSVDQTNLTKAVVRSPINGLVLKRQVEPGQTVAASLQTPVLFTLAENLAYMKLLLDVDEADVGQVKTGQQAIFTVDAYPDRTFPAVITQVRYAPETVEGVVTYQTVLSVNNADLALRPGMTTTAEITVTRLDNALLVPNTALRFTPPALEKPASNRGGDLLSRLLPRPPAPSSTAKRPAPPRQKDQQHVWTLDNGVPVEIPVTVGATDGHRTAIVAGDLEPGTPVIVDVRSAGQ